MLPGLPNRGRGQTSSDLLWVFVWGGGQKSAGGDFFNIEIV